MPGLVPHRFLVRLAHPCVYVKGMPQPADDDHVLDQDPNARFLVVAPTSVVENWHREAAVFAPGVEVRTITETAARRGRTAEDLLGKRGAEAARQPHVYVERPEPVMLPGGPRGR